VGTWKAVKLCAAAAVVLIVLAFPAGAGAAPGWTLAHLMRALDGRVVSVDAHKVRVVADSALCGGEGRSRRVAGARRWTRFACTYTTFGRSGIERDLEFTVTVAGPERLRVSGAAWVPGLLLPSIGR
jgi:hypothetical protein